MEDLNMQKVFLDQDYLRTNFKDAGFGYMLPELLAIFREQAAAHLKAIEQLLLEGNLKGIAEHVHALKGTAASVGASAIKTTASQLETSSSTTDLKTLEALIKELRQVTDLTDDVIAKELVLLQQEDDQDFF